MIKPEIWMVSMEMFFNGYFIKLLGRQIVAGLLNVIMFQIQLNYILLEVKRN